MVFETKLQKKDLQTSTKLIHKITETFIIKKLIIMKILNDFERNKKGSLSNTDGSYRKSFKRRSVSILRSKKLQQLVAR